MKKRRTKEEIDDTNAFATKVGLDGRITSLCKTKIQVEVLFRIQEELNERCTTYFSLKHAAPKERVKEYEAAIKHKESLAAYLYDSGQLEALETLRKVEIEENEPKVKDFIGKNRKVIIEKIEKLNFSKTSVKEIENLLIEYLQGKHQSEYCESGSGSPYKQIQKYLAEGNHIQFIESKNK